MCVSVWAGRAAVAPILETFTTSPDNLFQKKYFKTLFRKSESGELSLKYETGIRDAVAGATKLGVPLFMGKEANESLAPRIWETPSIPT